MDRLDNCGIASYQLSKTFNCSAGNHNVILTVTDYNGNTANCTAVVTVSPTTINGVVAARS
jgi:hypothetical protein